MSIPNTTTAHIDFNDWLAKCPFPWRQEKDEVLELLGIEDQAAEVTYVFTLPD